MAQEEGVGGDDRGSTPTTRNGKGQFLPGVTGNPSGRPATPKEVREAAGCYTLAAVEVLGSVLMDVQQSASMRFRAAQSLLRAGRAVTDDDEDGSGDGAADVAAAKIAARLPRNIQNLVGKGGNTKEELEEMARACGGVAFDTLREIALDDDAPATARIAAADAIMTRAYGRVGSAATADHRQQLRELLSGEEIDVMQTLTQSGGEVAGPTA